MEDTDHPVDPFVKPTHQHYLLTENATPPSQPRPHITALMLRLPQAMMDT